MRRLAPIICLALLLGCPSSTQPPPDPEPTSDSIASAESYRVAAQGDVKQAKPYSNRLGKSHLERAKSNLDSQGVELQKALKQNKANLKGWSKTVGERDYWKRYAKDGDDRFFSKKQVRYAWITAASWVVMGVGAVFIKGSIGKFILNFLPFSNLFTYFASKWWGK